MNMLTKAEEQVMKVVWTLNGGLLMDIVTNMPSPQPHKNTVATLLKILVSKEFIKIQNVGRIHRYIPVVSKEQYSTATLSNVAKGYFGNSYSEIVSFLVEKNKLSVSDLELLLKQIKKNKK